MAAVVDEDRFNFTDLVRDVIDLEIGARIHVDFHADADLNDLWCFPSHCRFLLDGCSKWRGPPPEATTFRLILARNKI